MSRLGSCKWLLAALLTACNGGGAGGGDFANASVQGSAAGVDFDFVPSGVGAFFASPRSGEGELTVYLCEAGCAPLGGTAPSSPTRTVVLGVTATTAELRGGGVFPIAGEAWGRAERLVDGQPFVDQAVGGEVVLESSRLEEGGSAVGTFQLETASGGTLGGFFEAPLLGLSGSLVQLLETARSGECD